MPINIQPNVIVTPDYVQKLRTEDLLRQAQITNLQKQPDFEQQHINIAAEQNALSRAGLQETSRYHDLEMQQRALERLSAERGQDIQQRGQDMSYAENQGRIAAETRAQDLGVQTAKEGNASRIAEALVAHNINNGNDPKVMARALQLSGYGELAQAMTEQHGEITAKKTATALQEYNAFKTPDQKSKYLSTLDDPDVKAAVMHHLGVTTPTATVTGPTTANPNPGYDPTLLPRAAGAGFNALALPVNALIAARNAIGIPAYNAVAAPFGAQPAQKRDYVTSDYLRSAFGY